MSPAEPAPAPRPRPARAVVIGAGIGGLTAAVALHARGWHVTVLERAPVVEPVGSGIGLAPNAQRALDTIGLGDAVRDLFAPQREGGLRTPSGRWLSRSSGEAAAARFGGPVVIAHRAALVALLTARLPEGALRTGTTAVLSDPGDPADPARPATVTTANGQGGEAYEAELVVAADGIHSATRSRLFPGRPGPRYAGFTAWRIVVPEPAAPYAPHETWGRGLLWGTIPLHDGRVYAYATAALPPGGRAPDDEKAELLRRFGSWHHPVPAILAAAGPGDILRNDVYESASPLPAQHAGRVALLGDAAHAMTPNLGQGGCQAIEDAVVLAHHAPPEAALAPALAAYTRDRLPRTRDIVRRSGRIGRLTTWSSRPACALRAAAFAGVDRLAPGLVLRGLDGVADWHPPDARMLPVRGRPARAEGGRQAGPVPDEEPQEPQ